MILLWQTADFHDTTQAVADNFTHHHSFALDHTQFEYPWKLVETGFVVLIESPYTLRTKQYASDKCPKCHLWVCYLKEYGKSPPYAKYACDFIAFHDANRFSQKWENPIIKLQIRRGRTSHIKTSGCDLWAIQEGCPPAIQRTKCGKASGKHKGSLTVRSWRPCSCQNPKSLVPMMRWWMISKNNKVNLRPGGTDWNGLHDVI